MSSLDLIAQGPAPADPVMHARLPHVLLVVDGLPKALGGGERIVLRLAALLPRYGFRASILTFAIHPESSFRPSDAPCPVYLLPLRKTYDLDALRGALKLGRFLRDQNIRIVQTFFESSDLWAGSVTRALSAAKLVWSRRDMGILRGRKHTVAYRTLRRLPHAVFAVSQEVATHVVQSDGVPAERVQVIYNGLDVQPSPELQSNSQDAPLITTVGNIRRVKGHDLLIRAAAVVLDRHPNAAFTIAGEVLEPEYYEELKKLIDDFGIAGRFRFLGKVSNIQAHLEAASIFVLPSRSEGFSNALIEAMAAGTPSVATDVGGNAEAMRHNVSGLIVPPEDPTALAEALLRLLSSPALARDISSAARQEVEERFTSDAMMRKVTETYAQLLVT